MSPRIFCLVPAALVGASVLAQTTPFAVRAVDHATVTVRGVADGRAEWRGADALRIVGYDSLRQQVQPGRARIYFAPVSRLGQRAASLALDVPDGGDVRIAPGYRRTRDLLWTEEFEMSLSDSWTQAGAEGLWRLTDDGRLEQATAVDAPMLLVGAGLWGQCTVRTRVRVPEGGVGGLVLAWQDEKNYVAVELGGGDGARRIVEVRDGASVLLAEDRRGVPADRWLELAARLDGSNLRVELDGRAILGGVLPRAGGGVGLLADGTGGVGFDRFSVRRIGETERRPLFVDDFGGRRLVGFTANLPNGVPDDRSWRQEGGVLRHLPFGGKGERASLTTVRGAEWRDYLLRVRVRPLSEGSFGVTFRHQDEGNEYRLTWLPERGVFALSRTIGGNTYEVAASDRVAVRIGHWHELAVQAHGFQIQIDWDQVPILRQLDGAHARGRVGLFTEDRTDLTLDDLRLDPVHENVPTLAVVRDPSGELEILGHDPRYPGAPYWAAWTTPDLPVVRWLGRDGTAPFLVVDSARDWFGAGQQLFNVTRGMRGVLDTRGRLRARLEVPPPALPALHGAPFGVTAWVIDVDGEAIRSRFPDVR